MLKPSENIFKCKKWLFAVPLVLGLTACGSDVYTQFVSDAVTADQLEEAAVLQYTQVTSQAQSQGALVSAKNKDYQRLQRISKDLIPFTPEYNPKAATWNWQVQLINSDQINAWCMPGGKIAFYTAIISELKLTDDEIAMIMGHEMTHALREHALKQINKDATTKKGLSLGTKAAGVDDNAMVQKLSELGAELLSLKFSRTDETEADRIGQEIAARAGYNPQAAITLWEKMNKLSSGGSSTAPFLSTHPQHDQRISDLKANLPKVMPLYEEAKQQKKKK